MVEYKREYKDMIGDLLRANIIPLVALGVTALLVGAGMAGHPYIALHGFIILSAIGTGVYFATVEHKRKRQAHPTTPDTEQK